MIFRAKHWNLKCKTVTWKLRICPARLWLQSNNCNLIPTLSKRCWENSGFLFYYSLSLLPISSTMLLHAVPIPEFPVCLTSKTAIRHWRASDIMLSTACAVDLCWEGLWTGNHCSKSPWKLQMPSSIVEITLVLFISHIDYTMPEVKTEGSHPARISSPDLPWLKQDEWQERCCGRRNSDFSCLSPMWAVLDYDICIKH